VTAVEINPLIVDAVRGRFAEFCGGLYDDPRVEVVVGEGRDYLERAAVAGRAWDRVVLSGVDTFAATEAGAFALSENHLYTIEGVAAALRCLSPEGVLAYTRWWFEPPRQTLRLALTVAQEAAVASGLPPASLRSVFASGNGDAPLVCGILEGLAAAGQQARAVSPTQFHNSVHNAAAGYWGIAHGSTQPATCIGLHDDSFAAGLLKAVAEVAADGTPVLFCAYDHPIPSPLAAKRPTLAPFGTALVLAPDGVGRPLARVSLRYADRVPEHPAMPRSAALRSLAIGNPAARSLPLLESKAAGPTASQAVPYLDGSLVAEGTG
jgi:hypothetical protein